MVRSFKIFLRFLQRDVAAYRPMLGRYFVNQTIIFPLLVTYIEGYVRPNTLFPDRDIFKNSLLFAGSLSLPLLVATYNTAMSFLFDLEHNRFINYQMSVLSPRLVLFERIVFITLFSFVLLVPFFPIAKLLLGDELLTTETSWPALFFILLLACLTLASYNILAMCIMEGSHQMIHLWMRVSTPLFLLGGFSVPWAVIYNYSKVLGTILLLNPFVYITDGIRQAFFNKPLFFSLATCTLMLLLFNVLFFIGALWAFKRKTDHI
jgi:hypothetical protein